MRRNPGTDRDRDAAELVIDDLAFAGVHPCSDLDAQIVDALGDPNAQRIARAGPSNVA